VGKVASSHCVCRSSLSVMHMSTYIGMAMCTTYWGMVSDVTALVCWHSSVCILTHITSTD
jgi:hypothetical protein